MRVLLTVVPMAGHVGPASGLAAALVRRGHDVRAYTGSRHCRQFEAVGARAIPWSAARDFDEDDLPATFPLARLGPVPAVLALVRDGFIGTAPGQVRDLTAELDREPADVLVADSMSFGGVLTAELRHLPWALLNVLPFNDDFAGPVPPGRTAPARGRFGPLLDRAAWLAYRAGTTPLQSAWNQARRRVGLPADRRPYGAALTSPWLVLATGCPSLHSGGALPSSVRFVGQHAPAGLQLAADATDPVPARPLVLLTQGTHDVDTAELVEPALRGLAGLDVDVLATTGRRGRTTVGVAVPPNARVVDLVDFGSVLPKASVLVTNGGWGGVLAGLQAGVPLVVAAGRAPDKPHIAARVARAGVGVDLRTRRPAPDAVAAAVGAVLTEARYRRRAAEVAAELTALGGADAAVDLLERLG